MTADPLPFVTLVVPTLNEERHIGGLLRSISRQTYSGPFEVLVADGGSTDRTREIVADLARQHAWLRWIENPGRTQGRGFNLGIREARGDVIGYVGAHSELASDYLEQTALALRESGAAGVGGRWTVVPIDTRSATIAVAMGSRFGVGTADYRYRMAPTFTDTVLYGSYLRGPLEQVGGIDERLDVNEDYELNYRLRAAGHTLYFSPRIRITYFSRSSLGRLWRQYGAYGFWKARVLRQHPRSLMGRHLMAPAFVAGAFGGAPLALVGGAWTWLWAGGLAAYTGASLIAATALASRHGWRHWPLLPVVFATLHVAWGLGFWRGVWHWWLRGGAPGPESGAMEAGAAPR